MTPYEQLTPTDEEQNFSFSLSLERLLSDPEGCKNDLVRLFEFVDTYGIEAVKNPGSCGCEDLPGRVGEMLADRRGRDYYALAHQLAEEIFNDLWAQKTRGAIAQQCNGDACTTG